MQINPFLQIPTSVTVTSSLPETRNWQSGQILEAVAVSQSRNGQVQLQIGQTRFTASVQFPVEEGQKLALEVTKTGNTPKLQLAQTDANTQLLLNVIKNTGFVRTGEALRAASVALTTSSTPDLLKPGTTQQSLQQSGQVDKGAVLSAALRSTLPRVSTGIAPLLSNLAYLNSGPPPQDASLSRAVLVLARTFFNLLPEPGQVSTPSGLKQAIRNSGIFLENKLSGRGANTSGNSGIPLDLKAGLLKLQHALQQLSHHQTATGSKILADTAPVTANKPVTNPGPLKADDQSLDLAKRISHQIRDTTRAIRNAILPGRTILTAGTDRASHAPQSSTGLPQAPRQPAQISPEALLKALLNMEELPISQIKKALFQAQARTTAAINQQSTPEQMLATLLRDTESSLARLQLHQLTTSQTLESEARQVWIMELPVRKGDGTDVFHLHIEREARENQGNDPEKHMWSIRLSFILEELGQVNARISIIEEQVSAVFWLEKKQTADLFRTYTGTLEESLTRAGLSIDKLNILNGNPPEEESFFSKNLVYEKA